jgi:hypothetical protein
VVGSGRSGTGDWRGEGGVEFIPPRGRAIETASASNQSDHAAGQPAICSDGRHSRSRQAVKTASSSSTTPGTSPGPRGKRVRWNRADSGLDAVDRLVFLLSLRLT